ncbi:S-layer homology domain-containing protein [Caryophanon tenue]|uniref:SLH domain-containing protein n=1 Tax=Caryophanon tenue TaxID=33978 RepID=A0A1C0YCP8_9BACL|nr:S-layer homology domain-containing protein [Caryophanon tenue]OCS84914.1 hypothetical protein A6M13_14535 [Caryophanon tenue]
MKKRNVWRSFSTASIMAVAVTAASAPTASAEETVATADYLETYYQEFSFITNDGTPVTVTYDAETNTYIGNVPLNTTAVTFNLPLKDGYTSTTSATYKLTFTTTAVSYYSENVKGRNIEIKDADKNVVANFRVELTRPAEPQTVETSSELLSSSITFYNGRNASVSNPRFYVEEEGELKVVSTNNQLKDENIEKYDHFIVKPLLETNTQNIETITLAPVAKYFDANNPDGAQYTYRVNGEIVDSLTKIPHTGYEYEPGKLGTKIEVTVTPGKTAPEGSKAKTYTFIVPKEKSTETTLTGFTIGSANNHQFLAAIGEGKLTQKTEAAKTGFNKGVSEYETIMNYNVDNILVKTTAEGPYTTFVYNINGEEVRTTDKQKIVPLKVGKNIVTVQAVPENGDATNSPVYTLHAERKENYNIASIKSDEIRISGKLRPTLTTLAGIIEEGIEKYTIDLAAEDATKTITIQQNGAVIAEGKGSVKATLDASNILIEGTKNISQNPVTIVISDENDSITYTLDTWKRNPDAPSRTYAVLPAPGQFVNEHAQTVTGSLGSFGWGDGWDTALYSTSASLSDEASGKPGLSLGGFGGFVTYQFDNPVKNDPAHPYGADFIVNGNGFSGNEEPGGVMVAQDKDKDGKPDKDADGNEIWYELAGSEHYEDTTLWDYSITYKNIIENFTPNFAQNVPWVDSLGRTGEILANGYHSQIYFPMPENYQFEGNAANDMMGDEITFNGTNIQTLKSSFGYADVSPNNKGITTAENPYTHKHGGGGFMDIAWAVDKDGKPVQLDEVSFVKIYTNQQTDGGAVGEKSPEILGMLRVNDPEKSDGKTATPIITVNDAAITLGTEDDFTPVVVESLQNVKIDVASGADNIFINNQKVATRTYEVAPEKGIVRVITQTGDLQPTIHTLKLVEKAVQDTIDAIAALPAELTLEHVEAVTVAQAQYDALTEAQQALITNKDVLAAAQATVVALEAEKATNEAAAKAVEEAINALPETLTLEHAAAVEAASVQYEQLTDRQKELVPNTAVLNHANETIAALQAEKTANEAAAKAVEDMITALPETITLAAEDDVQAAFIAYELLTDVQKALVPNQNVLDNAKQSIADLQTEADKQAAIQKENEAFAKAVEEAINALPETLTLEHAVAVQETTSKYNSLTETQQALVPNQDVLNKAQETIQALQAEKEADEAAAKAVANEITALPALLTLNAKDAVQNVKAKFDLLTAAQQALVSNKEVLDKALQAIAYLQAEADQQAAIEKENEAAAKAVQEAINALPETLTLAHAETVQDVATKYDSLTEVQQALVTNKDVLDAAKKEIARLQQQSSNSGGGSYYPTQPSQPTTPEVTEPEVPEVTTPETTEPEAPEETTPEQQEQTWVVTEGNMSFSSVENIVLTFTHAVPGTVANLHVVEDHVQLTFAKDDEAVILSDYVEVVIPQDVLSPKEGVLVQRLADGSVVAVPHHIGDNGEFVAQLRSSGEVFVQNNKKTFSDISQDGHKAYIEALAERLIVNGTTANTFSPKATMTRGQFAAMLQRSLALPKTSASTFKDTVDNQFAYELQTLVDIGVLKGDGDLLRPKDNITRKHAALMIARLLEHLQLELPNVSADDVTFTDKASITPDALEAVALMQKLNIFSGKEDGRFDPNASLTRSQMAKVLYQTLTYAKMM